MPNFLPHHTWKTSIGTFLVPETLFLDSKQIFATLFPLFLSLAVQSISISIESYVQLLKFPSFPWIFTEEKCRKYAFYVVEMNRPHTRESMKCKTEM